MKSIQFSYLLVLNFLLLSACIKNNKKLIDTSYESSNYTNEIKSYRLSPKKITWLSDTTLTQVKGADRLLQEGTGQALLSTDTFCYLRSSEVSNASILLDFGKEIHGGIEIVTGQYPKNTAVKIRLRFGESVGEAMAELGGENNATNDHAIRDLEVLVPWLGSINIGDTGFRFVRIDLLDKDVDFYIKEVNAIAKIRDIEYKGSFNSSDSLLNKIWDVGAYTVHLNMQNYLWDGIKRDRLVWVGDMHPEVRTITSVFGANPIVPKTLDFAKNSTPPDEWMNGISSYSLWWIIIQYEWYMYTGELDYLRQQEEYLWDLVTHLSNFADKEQGELLDGMRFLDWPTKDNKNAVHAGLNSLFKLAMKKANAIGNYLNNKKLIDKSNEIYIKLNAHTPASTNVKQSQALMAISGNRSPDIKEALKQNGSEGISAFYGYYVLEALGEFGDIEFALNVIREYWGGMLKMGATTFWEEFELNALVESEPIDIIPTGDKMNYHAETGDHCYIGYRRSLCHGWASGPTPWLTKFVLGIEVLAPGCKKIKVSPNLGNLEWVEGVFPTPYGPLKVRHERNEDGKIVSQIEAPEEIEISQ